MTFSLKYINLFVVILFLVSLFGSFESVSAAKDGFDNMCEGFKFDSEFTTVKDGEILDVKWSKGESLVDTVENCEMFGDNFWKEIWIGGQKFGTLKELSTRFLFKVPDGVELPQTIFLRTWGSSDKGPRCLTYTKKFQIVA